VILVDTNVLLDLVTDDPVWAEWSQLQLRAAAATDVLVINEAVFAELSVRYAVIDQVETMVAHVHATLLPTPKPALFLAGKAFQRYRAAGGIRTGVLPDFFLGAHAQITDSLLLTRDVSRYRTYFPLVELSSPTG
jgi:predicted nucleic acid-binding protein